MDNVYKLINSYLATNEKRKILAVICTFNPDDRRYDKSFEDFSHPWFDTIRSWLMQRDENLEVDIVIADNVSGPKTRAKLIEFQKREKDIYIDFINQHFTTPFVCFNHAVSLFKKRYDYYVYCASDASFLNKVDLKILLNEMDTDKNCCIIAPQANRDVLQRIDFNKNKEATKIRLGQGVNAHIYIFTREFMELYDYKWIDIFGGPRTEGLFPYLCAAIKKHLLLSHKVCINHIGRHDRRDGRPLLIFHCKRDFFKMLKEGTELGLGFEEISVDLEVYKNIVFNEKKLWAVRLLIVKFIVLSPSFEPLFSRLKKILPRYIIEYVESHQEKPYYHPHNPSCFDENGYSTDSGLYDFIKQNLFLKKDELNYEEIPYQLIKPR